MTASTLPAHSRLQRPAARRSRRAMRRARTLAVLLVLLVATLVLVLFPRPAETGSRLFDQPGTTHTVSAGDTLWEIAEQYAGRRDIREMILIIREANNLDSVTIQPGQTLVIPAVKGTTIAGR